VSSDDAKPFDESNFKIQGKKLAEGTAYTWKCTVSSASNPALSVSAKWQASKNNAPTVSSFYVLPKTGDVNTEFKVYFDGVVDNEEDIPYTYEISYKYRDETEAPYKTHGTTGQIPYTGVKLTPIPNTDNKPTAVKVRGFVTDKKGSVSKYYYATIEVAAASKEELGTALTSEKSKISDASLSSTARIAAAATTVDLASGAEASLDDLAEIVAGVAGVPIPTDKEELVVFARAQTAIMNGLASTALNSGGDIVNTASGIVTKLIDAGVELDPETASTVLSTIETMLVNNSNIATAAATDSTDADSTAADSTDADSTAAGSTDADSTAAGSTDATDSSTDTTTTTASTTSSASTTDLTDLTKQLGIALGQGQNTGESSTVTSGNTTFVSQLGDTSSAL